jgi:hypothetical protein
MTKIQHDSPVVRETDSLYKGKPLIVELHGSYIAFRVKGTRNFSASVSYEGAFQRALDSAVSYAASAKREGKPRKVSRGLLKTGNKGIS